MSIERIRKLRTMTTGNGCTEAEATAAAEMAARIMGELGLRDGDVEFGAEQVPRKRGARSERARLWPVIAACTNTAVIIDHDRIEYVGRDPWPEVAAYLHEVTDRAIDRELRGFQATTWYKRRRTLRAKRAATGSFVVGMVHRLAVKLQALFADQMSNEERERAKDELALRYPESAAAKVGGAAARDYWEAKRLGLHAGDRVGLAHGVGGSDAPRRIGRAA